ncbi:MAG: putrescine ABC transporter permease PotI, partial [Aurantimonas coralicida]|nr:putrescine ABC transporter permease PotI [Aurantimonas coralicida]
PKINAVCTLLIAVVSVGVIIAAILNKRHEVQKARDAHLAATAG